MPKTNFEIPSYTLLELLGRGGFGEVYLARYVETDELVALKVMLPKIAADQRDIKMFQREIENTKALQHRNIVRIRDSGCFDDTFFFILEYCDDGSVDDLMRQQGGKLSIEEATEITLQALNGLEYAHNAEIPYVELADGSVGQGRGLVHRDIKPANIFLATDNSKRVVKVGDYGLAKAFALAGLSGITTTGSSAGTPAFMARQQVIDFKYVKPEVDIWAIAASLYNMLTGTTPRKFPVGENPWSVVLHTNPIPIRQRDAAIPERLAELIDLALLDNPNIHFKNATAFKRALESVL